MIRRAMDIADEAVQPFVTRSRPFRNLAGAGADWPQNLKAHEARTHSAFMMILAASKERLPTVSKSSGFNKWSSMPGVAAFLRLACVTPARSQ